MDDSGDEIAVEEAEVGAAAEEVAQFVRCHRSVEHPVAADAQAKPWLGTLQRFDVEVVGWGLGGQVAFKRLMDAPGGRLVELPEVLGRASRELYVSHHRYHRASRAGSAVVV